MSIIAFGLDAVERGLVPDVITRAAIRKLCRKRLNDCVRIHETLAESHAAFLDSMRSGPLARVPEKANEQHYELPPEFFIKVLGPHRKYSSCLWPAGESTLEQAEVAALEVTCQRAELANDQNILELGCGWGSLSLWMAAKYPGSRIIAVSNSTPQRQFIESQAAMRGLSNLEIVTADLNHFTAEPARFDRVVSVEMFEHMWNYEMLLQRIASWLRPDGRLFVHHFCHRRFVYAFETRGEADWMARYFFTGGIMPCENLLSGFDQHLQVLNQWRWDGKHYQKTSEAWLKNLDAHRGEVLPMLESVYGAENAVRWFYRWRVFFLAVSELFGYADGKEWFVSHSLLRPSA